MVVRNSGGVAGDETVFAYVEPDAASIATLPGGTPVERRRLFAFRRVHLAAGAAATTTATTATIFIIIMVIGMNVIIVMRIII